MDTSLIMTAFGMICEISFMLLAVAMVGGLFAGLLRVATQIDDSVIGLGAKLFAVIVLMYISGGYIQSQILSFSKAVWLSQDAYL